MLRVWCPWVCISSNTIICGVTYSKYLCQSLSCHLRCFHSSFYSSFSFSWVKKSNLPPLQQDGSWFKEAISRIRNILLAWNLARVFVHFITSFNLPDSGLSLLNGFDFYFDLFWMAWDWKPAIVSWLAVFLSFRVSFISVLSAEKNENWPQIFHFCLFQNKWKLNTDFHFVKFQFLKQQNLEKYENWKSIGNFYFLFLKLKKKNWKLNTDYQFFNFQLRKNEWP